jgi:hypothetical protein
MSKRPVKYSTFADQIDVDAFEEAIDFEPLDHLKGEDVGYCPDLWGMHKHGDSTGKFAINREKRVYHCWVCGGGNFLSLAMEFLGEDEEAATEWLKQFAHGDIRSDSDFADDILDVLAKHEARKAERMPYFNEHVLGQFDAKGEDHVFFKEWCASRGIDYSVMVTHKLGYSSSHRRSAPLEGGEKIDDDFFGRVAVFPHYWEGRLVGWQQRWIDFSKDDPDWPKWLPKYTNTSDFPKTTTLYNYVHALKSSEKVVVVESVPTVLFLESMGVNAVATFGSGAVESQLRLLRDFTQGVIIAPDNDAPGEKFAQGATQYLERYVEVTVLPPVKLKPGADLGDYMDVDDPVDALYDHLQKGEVSGLSVE